MPRAMSQRHGFEPHGANFVREPERSLEAWVIIEEDNLTSNDSFDCDKFSPKAQ
jgi:hypothetical protein